MEKAAWYFAGLALGGGVALAVLRDMETAGSLAGRTAGMVFLIFAGLLTLTWKRSGEREAGNEEDKKMDILLVILTGALAADPYWSLTAAGDEMVKFPVAVDVGGGEEEWVSVIAFGAKAEYLAGNVKKGDRVSVVGKLKYRRTVDRTGAPKRELEVKASNVSLMSKHPSGEVKA